MIDLVLCKSSAEQWWLPRDPARYPALPPHKKKKITRSALVDCCTSAPTAARLARVMSWTKDTSCHRVLNEAIVTVEKKNIEKRGSKGGSERRRCVLLFSLKENEEAV